MNMSFKKIMASVTAVAVVAMNMSYLTVNAAAINNATAVVTAGVGIVVTGVGFVGNGDTCTASITKTLAGGANSAVAVTACAVTNDTTLTLTAAGVAANEYYTIAFSTASNVFGTTTAGSTTNNVVVSARVLPILSMSISNATVDLGVLSALAPVDSTTDTTITIATNANGGYVVSAAASDFVGATTTNVIPFVTRVAQANGVEGFSLDIVSATPSANGTSVPTATAGLGGASTYAVANGTASIASGTATADGDLFVVNYAASISPVTEADSYSTTVTYTVSGTF